MQISSRDAFDSGSGGPGYRGDDLPLARRVLPFALQLTRHQEALSTAARRGGRESGPSDQVRRPPNAGRSGIGLRESGSARVIPCHNGPFVERPLADGIGNCDVIHGIPAQSHPSEVLAPVRVRALMQERVLWLCGHRPTRSGNLRRKYRRAYGVYCALVACGVGRSPDRGTKALGGRK